MTKIKPGAIAYMVGFFGAILIGLLVGLGAFEMGVVLTTILIISGIVIGLINIVDSESIPLMVAALVIGGGAGILSTLPWIGEPIASILSALAMVILPAAVVVAFKVIMQKAK